MIDLDELEARIAEGEKKNFFVAPLVKQLIAELREARRERAAVVAWLRSEAEASAQTFTGQAWVWAKRIDDMAEAIERGEHRKGET